ncbi:hypothetical protein Aph01nite_13550 [Acrocarpospora phusangensis]|uniref:Uncharacterized protein n=1 Tax=Acrocarpospora phusangensis TaxID=1070424 RepID=A0A919UNV5_9ACTN|nr:DUF5304 family protein [Acrocarpospora phusangensis]GIH23045.1 hypothetical protein Aph01nite_13550 [Acrocarpospora phusangensis]
MTESNDRPDPLGSAAEEAMKFLDSLQQRVGREIGKGFVKGAGSGLSSGLSGFSGSTGRNRREDVWGEAVSGHDHEEYICRACPVCRVIAARKESGGDVTDHLIAAGGELLAAFRQAVDALQRPATPRRQDDSRVEHIDLG